MYYLDTLNECWTWWDGNIFLAYTTDEVLGRTPFFANKARDVLKSVFKDSDVFNVDYVGPTPIHPDITIVIFSKERLQEDFSEPDILRLARQPVKSGEDIMVPIVTSPNNEIDKVIHQAAWNTFRELRRGLERFYAAQVTRSLLISAEGRCADKAEALIKELMTLQDTPVYKFWVKRKLSKLTSRLTSEIHSTLLREYELRTHLADFRGEIESCTRRDAMAYIIRDYLLELTAKREYIDRECVSDVLRHVDQELGRHSAFNTQLISAFLGALVAVGLMYAGAYLIKAILGL